MKDIAVKQALAQTTPVARLNILREYLQAFALRSLHESGAFLQLSFVGGTALRFLYNLPRFSEDMDFSLENADGYKPERWMKKIKRDFEAAGFKINLTWNDKKTVHVGWLRVAELLKEVELSNLDEQKISIKLEVDTRPPAGAVRETNMVNRYMLFLVRHYDLPSLMAGKIHAVLVRNYPKGRDWYDLMWYLSQRPVIKPNLIQLNNALIQTEGDHAPAAENWRELALDRFKELDSKMLRADVEPFLESVREAAWLNEQILEQLLI